MHSYAKKKYHSSKDAPYNSGKGGGMGYEDGCNLKYKCNMQYGIKCAIYSTSKLKLNPI